jgi:MFS family permease
MTTTLTSGDILIHILIFFGGAFALWFLQKSRSVITDYLSSRSVSSRLKRISSLESRLAKYESDFSDGRIFIGRIIITAVTAMVLCSLGMLVLGLAFLFRVAHQSLCNFRHDCVTLNFWTWDFSQLLDTWTIFLLLAGVSLGAFFGAMGILLLETSPEKFRARMNDRIARLRDGIQEN